MIALEPGVPYFGNDLAASQGIVRHKHFAALAQIVSNSGSPAVLEVGTWAGCSLAAWDRAFGGSAEFTVVDSWEPYWIPTPGLHDIMNEAAASGDIVKLFWHNVSACGMDGRVTAIRGDSRVVLRDLIEKQPGRFDLAFVDGNHRYGFAVEDVRNCMGLVRVGGVLCGDDLEAQLDELPPDFAPGHAAAVEAGTDWVSFGAERVPHGYHPGVAQAVAETLGNVSCFDGLWAMRRTADGWSRVEIGGGR